ncbi:PREDICTED: probably inactive leucine-rich repeat receptor-like protein kinase At2g25790 isoform X4 [Ipomoea nil]|uniref:probably inactive leucine-rich repeat receptor-like protein kinase At2g25790 isoform X4 n=1 Tax=Ipomoea nil TaxID=35883 RepID=UPI00090096AB|nr:PREDICTED: probably inactive leucine-rich repeat receptor-like protein kinase At2g25790 isoform X4 [Ipomoea nil]
MHLIITSFLLLLLVIFSLSLQQMPSFESAEGRALLQWKQTLSNTHGVLDSWSLSNLKNICNWTGIACNTAATPSYVSKINLSSYNFNLTGTSKTKRPFRKLHIFDISHNDFRGALPRYYLENFEQMQTTNATADNITLSYDDYIDLMLKMKEAPVQNFEIVTLVDLSNNHFHGEIPESIGKLSYIRFLNLSHNQLTGCIPSSLGNLSILEVLDLSSNQLVGKIPEQLAKSLTFLAVLNLSCNHLVGPIPHGPQFNTFSNDSFMGNTALCGFPLTIQCHGSNNGSPPQTPAPDGEEDSKVFGGRFGWRSVVIGYCSCMPFGIFVGCLAFLYERPRWFVRFVLILGDKK